MIFLDTAYFVALVMRRDALHEAAVAWSHHLSGPFLTTEYVLWEFLNRLSAPPHRAHAHSLLSGLLANPQIQVVPASGELFRAGVRMHANRPDKSWSLTDCLSFVVMGEHQIIQAMTADRHFEQAGLQALMTGLPQT